MKETVIHVLGIGNNTVTVLDLIEDCGYKVGELLHFSQERVGELYFGYAITGCFEDLLSKQSLEGMNFALSMGNLHIRKNIYDRIIAKGGRIPSLVHPTCTISKRNIIGNGVQILPGSIVQGDSSIGDNTVITVNSVVAHSAHVGSHCLISGNVMIGAYSNIGNLVHIGQGATVVSGKVKNIGDNCVLGAGATLITDMPSGSIFAGTPAKMIKRNE